MVSFRGAEWTSSRECLRPWFRWRMPSITAARGSQPARRLRRSSQAPAPAWMKHETMFLSKGTPNVRFLFSLVGGYHPQDFTTWQN